LSASFHKVVGKQRKTIQKELPRLLLWANDKGIASTLNFDFVAFQLKFTGNSDSLAVPTHEEFRLLSRRHRKSLSIWKCIYAMIYVGALSVNGKAAYK
jgi:hypothetical protein